MNKTFLCLCAFFTLTASDFTISDNQQTNEYGNDCMGQRRPGMNIHDLLFEDDQIKKLSYPTYCCEDYYIRFSRSSIPILATSSIGTRPNYVVDISMSNTNISAIMPGTFTGLNYLSCLDLSQNNISFIPIGLFNELQRLYILNLANNNLKQLYDNAFHKVPLKKLFLQNNMLSFLADLLFSSQKNSLTQINLSKNFLKDINNTFVELNSLVSLNLNHNYIKHANLVNIYSTEIYLRNNNIFHISAPRNMTRIIDLSENNIESIGDLGRGFYNSSIEKLYLSRNKIHLNHNSLDGLHHLTHLYLDNNMIRNLSSMVFRDVKSLIFLDISLNDISQFQYGTFDHFSNLQFLNVSCNNFSVPQLHKLSHILAIRETIQMIDLSENKIQSIEDLGNGFINSSIAKIYLSRNAIQLKQSSLVGLYNLTHLYLDNNKIRNISKMVFKDLNHLICLDLSHNYITQFQYDTFDHVSDMHYLNISFNKLTQLQLHVFSPLQKLIEFDFQSNQITAIDIKTFLHQRFTLRKIKVDGNLWKCKNLTNAIKFCETKNVEVVWGKSVDIDNVRGIACDSDDSAINNNPTETNVNENNVSDHEVLDDDFEIKNYTTEKNINENNVSDHGFVYDDFAIKNNTTEKNVNENNVSDPRFLEDSSVFNFLTKDLDRSNFSDYLYNLYSRKRTDSINLNSTSFYNSFNNQESNLFKYLEYLRLHNHEVSGTPEGNSNFLLMFGFLLVAIALILIVVFTILILLLKKGSPKSTRNICHQENVELL